MNSLVKTDEIHNSVEEELNKYLCFLLNNRSYAINISCIKEIMEHTEITPIPMMPEFFLGAINLRGAVVPVIDISNRLGMGTSQITRRSCIVIVEVKSGNEKLDVGVMVDAVSEVADMPEVNIEPPPSLGGQLRTEFMRGVGKLNEKFVILLNMNRILSMADVELLKELGEISAADHLTDELERQK